MRDAAKGFAMLVIVLSALILLACFIGWTITCSTVQPIGKAWQAARIVATGDLSQAGRHRR